MFALLSGPLGWVSEARVHVQNLGEPIASVAQLPGARFVRWVEARGLSLGEQERVESYLSRRCGLLGSPHLTGYGQVVEELTVSGGVTNLSKVYTVGMGLVSQRVISGSVVSFYGTDGHGSVRFLTRTNGLVTDTYTFDAFGTLIAGTITTSNNYLYCGEQWDADLGRYFLRARYYEPGLGRFTTMDTFEGNPNDPLSLHKYLYCHSNPVNGTDPSGHEFNLVSLQASITTISGLAARYVGSIPGAARIAFGGGGVAIGRFLNQFGAVVQNFGNQVVNLLPRIEQLKPALEGFTRRPDFLLRVGNAFRVIEGKYQLPKAGEALSRTGSQIQQFTQWASQGANREVVVWALKSPEKAAEAEQAVLQAAGSPQGVKFVYGVEGLFEYLSQWAGF